MDALAVVHVPVQGQDHCEAAGITFVVVCCGVLASVGSIETDVRAMKWYAVVGLRVIVVDETG
jgi:hypothetical protein